MSNQKECPTSELRSAHEVRVEFFHRPANGVTLADVCEPGYWKHVWRQLNTSQNALIDVVAKDQSWEALLRVYAVGDGFAKVRVLREWSEERKPGRQPSLPEGWQAEFAEGSGWRVRNGHGEVIVSGQSTKPDAITAAKKLAEKVSA